MLDLDYVEIFTEKHDEIEQLINNHLKTYDEYKNDEFNAILNKYNITDNYFYKSYVKISVEYKFLNITYDEYKKLIRHNLIVTSDGIYDASKFSYKVKYSSLTYMKDWTREQFESFQKWNGNKPLYVVNTFYDFTEAKNAIRSFSKWTKMHIKNPILTSYHITSDEKSFYIYKVTKPKCSLEQTRGKHDCFILVDKYETENPILFYKIENEFQCYKTLTEMNKIRKSYKTFSNFFRKWFN